MTALQRIEMFLAEYETLVEGLPGVLANWEHVDDNLRLHHEEALAQMLVERSSLAEAIRLLKSRPAYLARLVEADAALRDLSPAVVARMGFAPARFLDADSPTASASGETRRMTGWQRPEDAIPAT